MTKYVLITLGFFFLILGFIGFFLPIMPTTPFAVLAAYFFSKSSPKFYHWCLTLPIIGQGVRDWRDNRVVRPWAKVTSTIWISCGIIFMWWMTPVVREVKIVVSVILGASIVFIITRKSR